MIFMALPDSNDMHVTPRSNLAHYVFSSYGRQQLSNQLWYSKPLKALGPRLAHLDQLVRQAQLAVLYVSRYYHTTSI